MAVAAEAHYRRARRPRPRQRLHDRPARHAEALAGAAPQRHRASSRRAIRRRTRRASRRPSARWPWWRTATDRDLVLVLLSGGASALWAAPGSRPHARRQDRPDARAAQVRRRHPRDEHRAPARLAHQGRPPAQGHGCAHADARHLRRAGRRSRPPSAPARPFPIPPRLPTRAPCSTGAGSAHGGAGPDRAAGRRRGAVRSRQRDAEARRSGLRQRRISHHRHARGVACRRRRARQAPGLRGGRPGRRPSSARPARSPRHMPAGARGQGRRPQSRHHQRRRAVRDGAQRPGPRRAQPGVRAGAGHGARRASPAYRRWRPTRTASTAATGQVDRSRRRHRRCGNACRQARRLDAQKFLDNNDATSFFEAAGGLIVRGPTHTNVNDFRVILVDA